MKEQLISFKTAELAKDKGFDIFCIEGYEPDTGEHTLTLRSDRNDILNAPEQSLLQKWLREEHNLIVEIRYVGEDRFYWDVYNRKFSLLKGAYPKEEFNYEEALEAGLQIALNLIE